MKALPAIVPFLGTIDVDDPVLAVDAVVMDLTTTLSGGRIDDEACFDGVAVLADPDPARDPDLLATRRLADVDDACLEPTLLVDNSLHECYKRFLNKKTSFKVFYVAAKATYIRLLHGKIGFLFFFRP